jgi:ribosome-binding protein aMBF1 (putative translation factor)
VITPELVSRVFAEPAPDEGDASFNAITEINQNIAASQEAVAFIVACMALIVRRWDEVIGEGTETKALTREQLAQVMGPAASLVIMGYRLGLAELEESDLERIAKASL